MTTFPAAMAAKRVDWPSDQWGTLRCLHVWDEARDIKTFLLAPDEGSRITFDPGQFMTFRTALDGRPVERCYTLSSSSASERTVAITVKAKPGGAMSGHLHKALAPGERISAFGPAGGFSPVEHQAEKYALISAGSGITPMLSMVRTAADLGLPLDADFVHVARTPRDYVAAAELRALKRRLPGLRLHFIATRPSVRNVGGRLTADALIELVPDLASRMVMCCGPDGFMESVRNAAFDHGVPPDFYAEESFDFGQEDDAITDSGAPVWRITFAKSGRSFDCPADTTILRAAKAAGFPIAASCAKGMCGTCKCVKISGDLAMTHQGGIRQREIDRGFVLPCSSRPRGDVVLDR
ncbi:MAG: hybrid-cluster NAD(P)-dependent oxidoreductase [Pseudomonadota bacterium]